MASALAGAILGVPPSRMRESVMEFSGLEHRLEKVLTVRGIDFYNDSKATNVDAALKSILSFERNIILILGGRDKGGDFKVLTKAVKERVKKIILIGEAKGKIKKSLKETVPMKSVSSMREAVRYGFSKAVPGDVILLAPACTSFDMFQNFEQRGRVFKQEVLNLIQERGKNKM
jgi:UDP-N-acetylmuramoylalanine--D-glutamate ligase